MLLDYLYGPRRYGRIRVELHNDNTVFRVSYERYDGLRYTGIRDHGTTWTNAGVLPKFTRQCRHASKRSPLRTQQCLSVVHVRAYVLCVLRPHVAYVCCVCVSVCSMTAAVSSGHALPSDGSSWGGPRAIHSHVWCTCAFQVPPCAVLLAGLHVWPIDERLDG